MYEHMCMYMQNLAGGLMGSVVNSPACMMYAWTYNALYIPYA